MPPRRPIGSTPATDLLRRSGIAHRVHGYATGADRGGSGGDGPRADRLGYGEAAAAALGVDPGRICKTLIASVDGRLVAAVVPVATDLDLKRLALAAGGRRAELADAAAAERASGSVIGGISPLAMRRRLPTYVDAAAVTLETILVSAGRRGLQVELAPADLVRLTDALVARLGRR